MLVGGTKLSRCSPPRNRLVAVDIVRELSLAAAETHSGEHPRSVIVGTDANDRPKRTIRRIPERVWRTTAREHARQIREILQPGLTPLDHPLNTGLQRQQRLRERQRRQQQQQQQQRKESEGKICCVDEPEFGDESSSADWKITALDPKNPVYNFLIEYYGLKGTKGVRRLMKWSPGLMGDNAVGQGDVLLEGATEDYFSTSLQTKGAYLWEENGVGERSSDCIDGVVYSPFRFVYGNKTFHRKRKHNESREIQTSEDGPLGAFLWYRSLLKRTMEASPVLHCYGLHEWAMQYQPSAVDDENDDGKESPPPPSAKYQSHLKLRIDRRTLNETVESNTIVCTHVDAWKFFSKEALPLNTFYRNADQRAIEQYTSSSSSSLLLLLSPPLRLLLLLLLLPVTTTAFVEDDRLFAVVEEKPPTFGGVVVNPSTLQDAARKRANEKLNFIFSSVDSNVMLYSKCRTGVAFWEIKPDSKRRVVPLTSRLDRSTVPGN
mmetsp:Transcript_18735/g.43169  ORF Transcript_18735/g.43169 Transcript_18735/m.43169 type:complete len:491 (+) Transcript_18735:257-1729(+)